MEHNNHHNKIPQIQEQDFTKIFAEMQKQAEVLFPNLQNEVRVFNDSQITIENYQQYLTNLDLVPSAITSNHVS